MSAYDPKRTFLASSAHPDVMKFESRTRLSESIEDVDDIIADLDQALAAV